MKTKTTTFGICLIGVLILALAVCFMGCSNKYVSNWVKVQDDVNIVENDELLYDYTLGNNVTYIQLTYEGITVSGISNVKVYKSGRVEAIKQVNSSASQLIITSINTCKLTIDTNRVYI